jgi:hypothetical protein
MLDTFVCGSGCLLVLAKLLDVPPSVAVPMAMVGALAVTLDLGRELKKVKVEEDEARRKRHARLRD